MKELFKKSVLMGFGLAALTHEKIKEWGKKAAKEMNMSEEEGNKFVKDLEERGAEAKESFNQKVHDEVQKILHKMNIPTKEQMDNILKRLEELEKNQE